MTRMSLDACQQKQVSDFKMVLRCNKAEATEAIKEGKAHCGATIREVEAHHTTLVREVHHTTLIREAEDNCTTIVAEAEAHCTANIRKAESNCVEKACSIQQLNAENMQHLEMDAIEEGGETASPSLLPWSRTSGLTPRDPWSPNGPPSTTHREHTAGHSSKHSPQVCSTKERPTP